MFRIGFKDFGVQGLVGLLGVIGFRLKAQSLRGFFTVQESGV